MNTLPGAGEGGCAAPDWGAGTGAALLVPATELVLPDVDPNGPLGSDPEERYEVDGMPGIPFGPPSASATPDKANTSAHPAKSPRATNI